MPHVLVGDDLDVLNVAGRLKDLAEDVLGNPLVETAHIERPLVGFRGRAPGKGGGAGGRHHPALVAANGRGDGSRNGVVVLRNVERRGGHVALVGAILAVVLLGGSGVGHGERL